MSNNTAVFGNEIELDGMLYVSADFLKQYPEYLDNELDSAMDAAANADTIEHPDGPEEGDSSLSSHKSQVVLNGLTYLSTAILRAEPNYVELKYNQKVDAALPEFVPNRYIAKQQMAAMRRRRRS